MLEAYESCKCVMVTPIDTKRDLVVLIAQKKKRAKPWTQMEMKIRGETWVQYRLDPL